MRWCYDNMAGFLAWIQYGPMTHHRSFDAYWTLSPLSLLFLPNWIRLGVEKCNMDGSSRPRLFRLVPLHHNLMAITQSVMYMALICKYE